jgi:hypothetical protein
VVSYIAVVERPVRWAGGMPLGKTSRPLGRLDAPRGTSRPLPPLEKILEPSSRWMGGRSPAPVPSPSRRARFRVQSIRPARFLPLLSGAQRSEIRCYWAGQVTACSFLLQSLTATSPIVLTPSVLETVMPSSMRRRCTSSDQSRWLPRFADRFFFFLSRDFHVSLPHLENDTESPTLKEKKRCTLRRRRNLISRCIIPFLIKKMLSWTTSLQNLH